MNKLAILASALCCGAMPEEERSLEDYGITTTDLSVHNPLNGVYKLYNKPAVCVPSFPIDNRHERRRLEKKYKKNNKRNSNYTQPLKRKRRK